MNQYNINFIFYWNYFDFIFWNICISLLLPAFHLTDISEIVKQCSIQFGLSPDKFEIVEISDKSPQINYGIKFKESYLSLSSIEDLKKKKNGFKKIWKFFSI